MKKYQFIHTSMAGSYITDCEVIPEENNNNNNNNNTDTVLIKYMESLFDEEMTKRIPKKDLLIQDDGKLALLKELDSVSAKLLGCMHSVDMNLLFDGENDILDDLSKIHNMLFSVIRKLEKETNN